MKSEPKDDSQHHSIPPFHKRFNIDIPLEEARQQFINRVLNDLDSEFPQLEDWGEESYDYSYWLRINPHVAKKLGKRYTKYGFVGYADTDDFFKFLKALEALHEAFKEEYDDPRWLTLENLIVPAIESSEIDLGIQWRDGVFWPSGAKLLDEALVDENLQWLSDQKYANVLAPFKKGLGHWMEAQSKPGGMKDTITEMYEALEALAKVVLGNDKDLSSNREKLVSALKLSDYYKRMLKDYIGYANECRHPPKPAQKRTRLSPIEVEAFVYTTGLFIRLVIQHQLAQSV